jgi:hypothetical protein
MALVRFGERFPLGVSMQTRVLEILAEQVNSPQNTVGSIHDISPKDRSATNSTTSPVPSILNPTPGTLPFSNEAIPLNQPLSDLASIFSSDANMICIDHSGLEQKLGGRASTNGKEGVQNLDWFDILNLSFDSQVPGVVDLGVDTMG